MNLILLVLSVILTLFVVFLLIYFRLRITKRKKIKEHNKSLRYIMAILKCSY